MVGGCDQGSTEEGMCTDHITYQNHDPSCDKQEPNTFSMVDKNLERFATCDQDANLAVRYPQQD